MAREIPRIEVPEGMNFLVITLTDKECCVLQGAVKVYIRKVKRSGKRGGHPAVEVGFLLPQEVRLEREKV